MKKVEVGQIFKNYKELCSYLDEPVKTGKSKQLQLKDWSRFFSFNKEGNQCVVVDVYETPLEKIDNRGGNNIKNIQPMIDYLMAFWDGDSGYYSFTSWFCGELVLINIEASNVPYSDISEIEKYCKEHSIKNPRLFCDYISTAKSVLKNIFLKALGYMRKKDLVEYTDGYMFTYRLGKRSLGHFETDKLNEIIIQNEIEICSEMNMEHGLSDKLKGRQNLLVIYGNENLVAEFNDLKLSAIMKDEKAMQICNTVIDDLIVYGRHSGEHISEEYPLLSYYRGISITGMEMVDADTDTLGTQVSNIIRSKTRQQMFKKKYINKYTGEIVYPYDNQECRQDILAIEKILFRYFDDDFVVTNSHQFDRNDDTSDIDELFDGKSLWGEPDPMENNYTVEEIMDMPTMSDVAV